MRHLGVYRSADGKRSGYNSGIRRSSAERAGNVLEHLRNSSALVRAQPTLMDTLSTIDDLTFSAAMRHEVVVDPTSDHALLEATRTGDEDAFAELVSRYRNQITSY